MNEKIVNIGDENIRLNASVLTLMHYKRLTGRDFHTDRTVNFEKLARAYELEREYGSLAFEEFKKLPKAKQDEFWEKSKGLEPDFNYIINLIHAMALSGGFRGDFNKMLANITPQDLSGDSELMTTVNELIDVLTPDFKKKVQAVSQ